MNDKEIDEMAKEIWRSEILCNTCGESTYTYCGEAIAKLLYNAGYRKIPENAVVLTKEEQEYLETISENIVGQLEKELQLLEQQARKETAREIYKKGKEYDDNFDMTGLGEYIIANFLTEEHGVDLGE